jgi:hypothetical protein
MAITFINRGHFFAPHVKPVLIDCNFIVDSTNGNGLGIRSLKGQGVANVFMHTSSTPGHGSNGQLNPNPQSGIIYVQLTDNFQRYYGGFSGQVSPLSGSSLNVDTVSADLTVGHAYVITTLGTSTSADWLALGVPPGVTPAPGVAFIAAVTGAGTGTGTVQAPSASGIDHIEVVGDNNLTLGPVPVGPSPNVGGWMMFQCLLNTTLTAPTNGTAIGLSFYMSQSSVFVAGE